MTSVLYRRISLDRSGIFLGTPQRPHERPLLAGPSHYAGSGIPELSRAENLRATRSPGTQTRATDVRYVASRGHDRWLGLRYSNRRRPGTE